MEMLRVARRCDQIFAQMAERRLFAYEVAISGRPGIPWSHCRGVNAFWPWREDVPLFSADGILIVRVFRRWSRSIPAAQV